MKQQMKDQTIPDNEILKSNEGSYFSPPTYARKLSQIPPSQHKCYECYRSCCGSFWGCVGIACCCKCDCYVQVPQGFVGIQGRFGKAYRIVDPGIYFVNCMSEQMELIDIKLQITDVPRQIVTTKDNVVINIDSVVYWRVLDPFVVKFHVADINSALMQRTLSTLRDSIGSHTLQEVIENREEIACKIKDLIAPVAGTWGVDVEAMLINDLRFTVELQENLSSVAKQQKIGESKVIAAKAEVDAAKLFREASEILNTPAAIQIRHLDTMIDMARSYNSKIIFVPEDMQ